MAFRQKGARFSQLRLLGGFARDCRGNVAAIVGIMIIPLVGLLALAGEISTWYTVDRSLQNATDAAAVAAARSNDQTTDAGGMARYQREAFAVTSQYGLVNGVNNVTLASAVVACPNGGSGVCYKVSATKPVPVLLSAITGFGGNTTLNGGKAQLIGASSIATTAGSTGPLCIVTLGGAGITTPLLVNGGPNTDLNGCSTVSNGSADCHGHPFGNSGNSYAIGPTNNCADTTGQDVTLKAAVSDPYAGLQSSIPSDPCSPVGVASSYPQEPKKGFSPGPNTLSGSYLGTPHVCGDAQLLGNVTLAPGTVLLIENGKLDLNGFTLTANGATIIFSGTQTPGLTPSYFPVGSGTLNLTAPTSGVFQNIVLYQDQALPQGAEVDITSAGNTPTWDINGVVEVPNSNVTISGAINAGVNDCFNLVALSLTINGTGSIANDVTCGTLTVPGLDTGTHVALVQ